MTVVRKANAGQASIEPPRNAPPCPRGHGKMRFNPTANKFQCGDRDCDVEATPKVTKESFRDVILTGKIELIKKGDTFFIHLPEEKVMVDVTSMVEDTGTGEVHGEDNKYSIMLLFSGITEMSEDDNG